MISLVMVYCGLLVLGPVCTLAQRRWPERAPDPVIARERLGDWAWWAFSPTVTGAFTRAATIGLVGILGGLHRGDSGPVAALPFVAQLGLALVLADGVGYLSHRLRHLPGLWELHAVHHASAKLDWLAAARMHPLDDAIDNIAVGACLLFAGFSHGVFEAIGPVLILHTLFTHMNVEWDLGPLRYVLASPRFHRWHHAREKLARHGVNYAGMFAIYDVLGRTFFMPAYAPRSFGADVPAGFGAQLAHPVVQLIRRVRS